MIRRFVLLIFIALNAIALSAFASTTRTKSYRSQHDFEAGESHGISIDPNGVLSLGPRLQEIFSAELPYIWASVSDSRGNLYLAGGSDGAVYRIDSGGKATELFKSPEPQVYALAIDSRDNLYIGTSPNGKVYRISASGAGSAPQEAFFDPGEVYIWAMTFDRNGALFVATGETGKIFKVDRTGKGAVFYDCEDKHVVELVRDRHGDFLAGTAGKGMVLKISAGGKAFVLHDSPLLEITDIYEDPAGAVFAAATGGAQLTRSIPPAASKETEQTDRGRNANSDEGGNSFHSGETNPEGRSAGGRQSGELYRIAADGTVTTFRTLHAERIYSLSAAPGSGLFLGTGEKGRIYQISSSGEVTLVAALKDLEITGFTKTGAGATNVLTSNAGKVYRMEEGFEREGEFVSEVYDARVVSQWGAISWDADRPGGTGVTIQTRSGNSEKPDKTWSEWSAVYAVAEGSPIESPAARYLQVKSVLTSKDGRKTPLVREITFSHLQKNVPPVISQIHVHTPGEYYPDAMDSDNHGSDLDDSEFQKDKDFQNHSFGRKSQRKGYRSVSWAAADDNGDDLSYDLFFRGVGEKSWRTLARSVSGSVYSWDSELMADGRYQIMIRVSDEPSNPPALALTAEKVSQPFVVDNRGPLVSGIKVRTEGTHTIISFSVKDSWTRIEKAQYGINAAKWVLVYPKDGICDSRLERFEIRLDSRLTGENTIVIKARDALGNIGFASSDVTL